MGAIDLDNVIHIGPQAGPQTAFLASHADIAIYGGAAGGGKTYGLLLDPLRNHDNKDFGGVIFRKTGVQVRNEGGMWDESVKLYSLFRAKPREASLEWRFPSGMSMSFAHLEHANDIYNYQGAQMPWLGFDELTHFSKEQFFYMLSRNRSTSGVLPRVRATCNPDPDSWVRDFIDWWIDPATGYAIPERSGVLRWFVRFDEKFHWANTKQELHDQYGYGEEIQPISVTFIPSKLQDNKILMRKDPKYLANLLAQGRVDRMRLLDGNWNVRAIAGTFFQREWFPIVDAVPAGWIAACRFWDRAATKPNETNKDPDWTRGLLLYKYNDGRYCVVDLRSMRDTPGQVDSLIKNMAGHDSANVKIVSQQDPGSAGVLEADHFIKSLAGYWVSVMITSKDKATRAKPVSSQCERHNILVLRAPWNKDFFDELENFSENPKDYAHDDIVDVLSGAFNELSGANSFANAL